MKVLTFGEIMLRLSSQGYKKLFQNDLMETSFCGAEVNVAVSLSNFGIETFFLTKVPDTSIGHEAINTLKYFDVDTSKVIYGGDRLGLYYLEKGVSQRASKVIYDRKGSSFATMKSYEVNWDEVFTGIDWFHFSGINPALNVEINEICKMACSVAKEKGITISCDVNYRSALWTEMEAQRRMKALMSYVDVYIGNEEDAEKALGLKAKNSNIVNGQIEIDDYQEICEMIVDLYGCKYVAITLRESISASINNWSGILYSSKGKLCRSREYNIQIVDRVGSGDSFSAGVIYGLLNNYDIEDTIEFAAAASCLKHTQEGDFNRVSSHEVMALVEGNGSGRVIR